MAGAPKGYSVYSGPIQGRSDLFKQDFDREIDGHGEPALWEQAVICPCSNNDQTDQPAPFCKDCDGTGWAYHSPCEIHVLVERLGVEQRPLDRAGMFWSGDVLLTARVETPIAYRHRVTLRQATLEFQERTTRLLGDRQSLRLPIATRETRYVLRSTGEQMVVKDRVNKLVHRVNERLVELHDGVDFDVTEDGLIDWRKGDRISTAPRVDSTICVNYYVHPRYVVTSLAPFGIRVTQTQLGFSSPTPILLPFAVTGRLDMNLHKRGGVAALPNSGSGE